MTITQLNNIIERNISNDELHKVWDSLGTTFVKFDIDTNIRRSHFLGQILHESGQFKYKRENLNYSAKGLYTVFRKYFKTIESAKKYERQPRKIANIVYANRMGNTFENDGWNFRGGGSIQITGRNNYTELSKDLQQDFISNPNFIGEYPYYILSAGWFWNKRKLNKYADQDNIVRITKLINGGLNGLNDRIKWTEKVKRILV